MPVVEQAEYLQKRIVLGAASSADWPPFTYGAATTVPTALFSFPLPFNTKIIALSAVAIGASGNMLGINVASGRTFGTLNPTGTITFTGTATVAGTCTITIGGPAFFQQAITFAIGGTNTPTQSAAAAVAAIAALQNPQIFATASLGVLTIYPLTVQGVLASLGAGTTGQTYQANLTGVGTQTVSPTTATAFGVSGTGAIGTPDNSGVGSGVVPPKTASAGQYLLPTFMSVPVAASGANTIGYPPIVTQAGSLSQPPASLPCFDIIFPCTRELTLVGIFPGYAVSTVLYVNAWIMPVLLNPTQPYQGMWTPNNTTIGAPSTD